MLTVEAGPRRIRRIDQVTAGWPLLVPRHALQNQDLLVVFPGQPVLIEADLAEDLYGDPLALLPAAALVGWRGIAPLSAACAALSLSFDAPQVIYASRAILLPCTGVAGGGITDPPPYPMAQARHLIACLMAEDLGGALRAARPGYAAL